MLDPQDLDRLFERVEQWARELDRGRLQPITIPNPAVVAAVQMMLLGELVKYLKGLSDLFDNWDANGVPVQRS